MAIPDFQTLMRPLLELHADGGEKTQPELRDALARQFELTEEDLAERLPSGTARTFVNRVAWASTHMKEAGLLVKPQRGISTITDRGQTVLRDYPERVDMSVLEQFPEYVEFRTRSSGRRRVTQPATAEQRQSRHPLRRRRSIRLTGRSEPPSPRNSSAVSSNVMTASSRTLSSTCSLRSATAVRNPTPPSVCGSEQGDLHHNLELLPGRPRAR